MIQGENGRSDSPDGSVPDGALDDGAGGAPDGGVYEWYRRGMRLLQEGSPAAAAQLLARAAAEEPGSRSLREALARAQFDSRQYAEAAESFRTIVELNPAEDYAHFGLGMALWRCGELQAASGSLAVAAAMRPNLKHYVQALTQVRATLRAREHDA